MCDGPPLRASLILLLLLVSQPLLAAEAVIDKITVKGGSVLKGKIKHVEHDKLILNTDYAGDVVIGVTHIIDIESDQHYSIRLISGETLSGYLTVSNGKILLREKLPAVARVDGRKLSFDDVDWIREKPTYLRYTADLNVGAQFARGNTDTSDLHFDGHFQPSFGWNTLRISGHYDKKEADGNTTTNRWLAALEYQRDIGRRWFVGASNSYEGDQQRGLDLRIIAAAGLGYRFFDDDPTFLSVLPGLAYVNEMFTDSSSNKDFAAFHWKLDFSRDLYKNEIALYHNNLYLNSLQNLGDIIIETKTGIKFNLAWDLKLSAEFQTDWENEPADGAKKLDTRYILKIGFEPEGDENDWFR